MVLLAIGVFSLESVGNWEICDFTSTLNPKISTLKAIFYFTRKKYAIGYAKERLTGAENYWELKKIQQVITREKALTKKLPNRKNLEKTVTKNLERLSNQVFPIDGPILMDVPPF